MLLGGGPSGFLDSIIAALSSPSAVDFLGDRDVIAFDYRGFGHSTPNLTCPADAQGQTDVPACIAALEQGGADLSGYTTREVAADVDAIRQALDLRPLNLWGTSYGSRVALAVDRDFPKDVRSMILDGPLPLQTRQTAGFVLERAAAVGTLIAGCEADPACGSAFPGLHGRYEQAILRLNASPLAVDGAGVVQKVPFPGNTENR